MESEFRRMLIAIDGKLKDNELDTLIFFCQIKAKIRETIKQPIHLFRLLEERQDISPVKFDYLKNMLMSLEHRKDLLKIVDDYDEKTRNCDLGREGTTDAIPVATHYKEFQREKLFLGNNLGRNWKFFMRTLEISDEDIEFIEHQNPQNMREQIYQAFQLWLDREQDHVCLDTIIWALKKQERNDLVRKIQSDNI